MNNHILMDQFENFSELIAIQHKDRSLSYQDLFNEACRIANGVDNLKVKGGVGIMLPNIPEFVSIVYGLLLGGYVASPISVLLTPKEIKHIVEDSNLSLIFVHYSHVTTVKMAIKDCQIKPEIVVVGNTSDEHNTFDSILGDIEYRNYADDYNQHSLTMYTSGTTGSSKGVMMSSKALFAQSQMLKTAFNVKPNDRILCVLPLFHAYGFNALIGTALMSGATIVLHDNFKVQECVNSLEMDKITLFAGVPTMYAKILDFCRGNIDDIKFSHLETCLTGGAPLDVQLQNEFETAFSTQIHEGYGLTETIVSVCSNRKGNRKIGSVGRPYQGVTAKAVDLQGKTLHAGDVGELVFRCPNIMLGYMNLPKESQIVLKDGWLYSGDLGYIDEDGFCFIAGRQKDLIIKSGYNIFPRDVEDVIRAVDIVKDVAVFGVPDRIRGETVVASVILKPSNSNSEARPHIERALKASLAKYKHPNDLVFLKEFPIGHTGKVTKSILRNSYLNQT
ncbi:class I adenylate-forming enzyme family protein [Vibrio sp. 10N.261.46.E11]|uniref:class I adenylate-forming enzyme family protein n=1 Tax=Vibrio sp. 10N.261.46.E11 TaxID=3229662 RepID=UPI00354C361D